MNIAHCLQLARSLAMGDSRAKSRKPRKNFDPKRSKFRRIK